MASIEVITATLWTVVKPGMKPKELCAGVRERHPEARRSSFGPRSTHLRTVRSHQAARFWQTSTTLLS